MPASEFDEVEFYKAIAASGARALLIGRRAQIALGIDVMTADYDFWIHRDDIDLFNAVCSTFDLDPDKTPKQARETGHYVLESDIHVDVFVAKHIPTRDGQQVVFEEVWQRALQTRPAPDILIQIPTIEDLILTKRFGQRGKDALDIQRLQALIQKRNT